MIARPMGWAACLAALLLLALALVAGRVEAQGSAPQVVDAWVRLPAAPGRPGAGYFTLTGGAAAERLVAASSPLAERIELHATVTEGGVSRMVALPGIDLPAGGELRFVPRGNHLMLYGLKPEAERGVPLTLRFASGRTLAVTARAVAPSALPNPQVRNPIERIDPPADHQHH